MEISTLIIGFILGLVLGALLLYFMLKSSQVSRDLFDELNNNFIHQSADLNNSKIKTEELLSTNSELISDLKILQNEKQELNSRNAHLSAQNENVQNLLTIQKEEITKMQELAKSEFQNLANKILEEKTEKFTALNQNNLKTLLDPLGENLEKFKNRVNEVYENEARERFSLNNTIKLMMEQTTKVSQEANNLATALKGQTKTQGDWGEMILERILEDSGLTKDREYFSQ